MMAKLSEGIEVKIPLASIYIARTAPDVLKAAQMLAQLRDELNLHQAALADFSKLEHVHSVKQAANRLRPQLEGCRFLAAVVGRLSAPATEAGLIQNEVEIEAAFAAGVPVVVFCATKDYLTIHSAPVGGLLNEDLAKRLENDPRVRFVPMPGNMNDLYERMRAELERMLSGPLRVDPEAPKPAVSGTNGSIETPIPAQAGASGSTAAAPEFESPVQMRMLFDRALDRAAEDRLAFADYANGIWAVVDNPGTQTPLVVALNAPWGAGKSSISRLVKERFDASRGASDAPPHRSMVFNAWQHDHQDNLTTAFVRKVAAFADGHRPRYLRIFSPLPFRLLDVHRRPTAMVLRYGWLAVPFAALLFLALGNPTATARIAAAILAIGIPAILAGIATASKKTLDAVAGFVKDPSLEAEGGSMDRVREQLGKLIAQACTDQGRFVIMVDDLERCRPPHAVDILEVVSQLLDHPRVVVILMGDMSIIGANVEAKYRDLAERFVPEDKESIGLEDRSKTFGDRYLQKIVQLQFEVPRLRPWRMREFAQGLVKGSPDRIESPGSTEPISQPPARPRNRQAVHVLTRQHIRRRLALALLESVAMVGGVLGILFQLGYRPPSLVFAIALGAASLLALLVAIAAALIARRDLSIIAAASSAVEKARQAVSVGDRRSLKVPSVFPGAAPDLSEFISNQVSAFLFRKLTRESPLFERAWQSGLPFLPPYPRSVKRYLNRLRLWIFIASTRGLFAAGVTPEHFGRWAALHERWPELGRKLMTNPDLLVVLESKSNNKAEFEKTVQLYAPGHHSDPQLKRFMSSEPLGPVIHSLVHLDPRTD